MVKVLVNGALGKMGREVLKAVQQADTLELVAAVDVHGSGQNVGVLTATDSAVLVESDLAKAIDTAAPQVVVDFTRPDVVLNNLRTVLAKKVHAVVGTTGFTAENLTELDKLSNDNQVGILIAPNFSIGAILLMEVSQKIIKYLPQAEIIELHHDQKLDAPSGTASLTAKLLAAARGGAIQQGHKDEKELMAGARGASYEGLRIHSVRLPGYVAHQEVIFGGLGETLTVRHDSISRESFMPGVVLACEKIVNTLGLTHGLDKFLN